MNNDFAILLTTYNGSMFVGETIDSIQSAILNAQFKVKLFVFDDNSTDATIEIINNAWRIEKELIEIYKNEQNLGLFANKNQGLQKLSTQYKWIFLIHQDDIVSKDWIQTGVNAVNNLSTTMIISTFS